MFYVELEAVPSFYHPSFGRLWSPEAVNASNDWRDDIVCATERSSPKGVCSRANIDSVLASYVHCNESLSNREPSTERLYFFLSTLFALREKRSRLLHL